MIYLDTMVVPLSLFLTVGYHAYLWHIYKNRPSLTTIGANSLTRRDWFLAIKEVTFLPYRLPLLDQTIV